LGGRGHVDVSGGRSPGRWPGRVGVAEVVDAAVAVGLGAEEGGEAADQVGVPSVPLRAHEGTAEGGAM